MQKVLFFLLLAAMSFGALPLASAQMHFQDTVYSIETDKNDLDFSISQSAIPFDERQENDPIPQDEPESEEDTFDDGRGVTQNFKNSPIGSTFSEHAYPPSEFDPGLLERPPRMLTV